MSEDTVGWSSEEGSEDIAFVEEWKASLEICLQVAMMAVWLR